jgi:hypothetical protein
MTNLEIGGKDVILMEDFFVLVKCYYEVLKHNSREGDPIIEFSPTFLKKIF